MSLARTGSTPARRLMATLSLVTLASLGLGLGMIGGANADALTEKTVKKIAAKVVKKKAPRLTVKHAQTASSATLLGGLTAGQLQTREYRYTLPPTPPAGSQTWGFPGLPAGDYLVTYNLLFQATAPSTFCVVQDGPAGPSTVVSTPKNGGDNLHQPGAAAGFTSTGGPVALSCSVPSGTIALSPAALQVVSFVAVDRVDRAVAVTQ